MKAMRYDNLVCEIVSARARRLIEVGTCKGERSELMIRAALEHASRSEISYFGFDLFEVPPEEEFSARTPPWSMGRVAERLRPLGVDFELIRGDSRFTLPTQKIENADLAFIDGGHSDETVRADFFNILPLMRPRAPILLDDFWNYPGGGGCNALVASLDRDRFEITLLQPVDEFQKPYGTLRTQMIKVVVR